MADMTAQLEEDRDDDRRCIAVMADVDAKMLNRVAKRNRSKDPFEVSGDALAIYKARH